MRSQRRSQFDHDHRRRADRAQQIAAKLHARQAAGSLVHIVGEAWTGPNRCPKMVMRAPCACRPEGSLTTGQGRALVNNSPFTLSGNVGDVQSYQSPITREFFGQGGTRSDAWYVT